MSPKGFLVKKRHNAEQIVAKLRQADIELGKELTVPRRAVSGPGTLAMVAAPSSAKTISRYTVLLRSFGRTMLDGLL